MSTTRLEIRLSAVFGPCGADLNHHIEKALRQQGYSYTQRTTRVFKRYVRYIESEYGRLTDKNASIIAGNFRHHVYAVRGNKTITSAHHDYMAWRNLMQTLVTEGRLPAMSLAKPLANKLVVRKFSKKSVLGVLNPHKWKEEWESADAVTLQALSDNDYLSSFIDYQKACKNALLTTARAYIQEAARRFEDGRQYIADTAPELFEDEGDMFHSETARGSGQRLSLFSEFLPNHEGLKNLVAFMHYNRNGLVHRDFPGATNHVSAKRNGVGITGRTLLNEHLGLSTDLAAACAIVIVAETGVNAESLYRLRFWDDGKNLSITIPSDEGDAFEFEYHKPRAGGQLNRLIPRDISHEINTEYCFKLIIAMTEPYRAMLPTDQRKFVFIADSVSKQGEVRPMSHGAFKSGFKRIAKRMLNQKWDSIQPDKLEIAPPLFQNVSPTLIGKQANCLIFKSLLAKQHPKRRFAESFIKSGPHLAALRVTCGIIAWSDAGGDPRAASRFLGNTTKVALKSYLPKALQDTFYGRAIRQFQNLLIATATDGHTYQQKALGIRSNADFEEYLSNVVEESDFYKRLKRINTEGAVSQGDTKIHVSISPENLAVLKAVKERHIALESEGLRSPFKKWHMLATAVLSWITMRGSRHQQAVMKKGMALYSEGVGVVDLNELEEAA